MILDLKYPTMLSLRIYLFIIQEITPALYKKQEVRHDKKENRSQCG